MPVSVVVGGQFGSEGKGKVARELARRQEATLAVRVGGPNSGHTVIHSARPLVLRQLPTAATLGCVRSVLPAGSIIDPQVLLGEIALLDLEPEEVVVDPKALVITDQLRSSEQASGLVHAIASTGSGTGEAILRRVRRDGSALFARDVAALAPYLCDTLPELRTAMTSGERILIEGTQGYGLSNIHAADYPFTTSRDTTAAGFLSECGLSPLDVDTVVVVLRAFPIRVAGNSGPLPNEITWRDIATRAHLPHDFAECTSVTGTVRRVAEFDPAVVRQALAANRPSLVVLNHLDYLVPGGHAGPHQRAAHFIEWVESVIGSRVDWCGLGPDVLVDRETLHVGSTLTGVAGLEGT